MNAELRAQLLPAFEGESRDHLSAMRRLLAPGAGAALDMAELTRRMHSLKGAARAMDLPGTEALAHQLEALFLQAGDGRLDQAQMDLAHRAVDTLEDCAALALGGHPDCEPAEVLMALSTSLRRRGPAMERAPPLAHPRPPAVGGEAIRSIRVRADKLDGLFRIVAELSPQVQALQYHLGELAVLRDDLFQRQRSGRAPEARPLAERLDRLLRAQEDALWRLRQTLAATNEDLRDLRMMAADAVFGGFAPTARELARALGKEVVVELSGMEVEADRAMLQQLGEPVLHLIRNAIAHGIETPEQRIAAGKRASGRLVLHVAVIGGRLQVRLTDDGRGLDRAAIAAQAVRRGLLTAEEAAAAPPERIDALIFATGLSTAAALSNLSGRGMGMSIVANTVEALQGELKVTSEPGRFTEVELSLPLALSVRPMVLMGCAGRVFALGTYAVAHLRRIPCAGLRHLGHGIAARLPEGDVGVAELGPLLGLPAPPPEQQDAYLVVMRVAGRLLALRVDEFLATTVRPVLSLDGLGLSDELVASALLLDDGRVALVLRPAALLARTAGHPLVASVQYGRPAVAVLVVDDSATTRSLEKSILEAEAYQVHLAQDGAEALDMLRGGLIVDAVVTDLEMPRLDGFALVRAIREDRAMAHLPVVIVSSRDSEDDRRQGLALGANAYIGKLQFSRRDLLDVLAGLLE